MCILVSKSDSDIQSLTLNVWYRVSDIESTILSIKHWLSSTWWIRVYQQLWATCGIQWRSSGTYTGCDDKWWCCPYNTMPQLIRIEMSKPIGQHHTYKATLSCTGKSKTGKSPAFKLNTAWWTSLRPIMTSAPPWDRILFTFTTLIKWSPDGCVESSTAASISKISLWQRGDLEWHGSNTSCRGSAHSSVLSVIPCQMGSVVSGDAQLSRFYPLPITSSGKALQSPIFRPNVLGNQLPLSLIDFRSRWPTCGATSSLAHSVVRGT